VKTLTDSAAVKYFEYDKLPEIPIALFLSFTRCTFLWWSPFLKPASLLGFRAARALIGD